MRLVYLILIVGLTLTVGLISLPDSDEDEAYVRMGETASLEALSTAVRSPFEAPTGEPDLHEHEHEHEHEGEGEEPPPLGETSFVLTGPWTVGDETGVLATSGYGSLLELIAYGENSFLYYEGTEEDGIAYHGTRIKEPKKYADLASDLAKLRSEVVVKGLITADIEGEKYPGGLVSTGGGEVEWTTPGLSPSVKGTIPSEVQLWQIWQARTTDLLFKVKGEDLYVRVSEESVEFYQIESIPDFDVTPA